MNVYNCQYLSMKSFKATFLRCFLNKSRHSVKKFKNEKKKKRSRTLKRKPIFSDTRKILHVKKRSPMVHELFYTICWLTITLLPLYAIHSTTES